MVVITVVEARKASFHRSTADLPIFWLSWLENRQDCRARAIKHAAWARACDSSRRSLSACLYFFLFFTIYTAESIYRGVLIAIACLIKLRRVCSAPIYFVLKISAVGSHEASVWILKILAGIKLIVWINIFCKKLRRLSIQNVAQKRNIFLRASNTSGYRLTCATVSPAFI